MVLRLIPNHGTHLVLSGVAMQDEYFLFNRADISSILEWPSGCDEHITEGRLNRANRSCIAYKVSVFYPVYIFSEQGISFRGRDFMH